MTVFIITLVLFIVYFSSHSFIDEHSTHLLNESDLVATKNLVEIPMKSVFERKLLN